MDDDNVLPLDRIKRYRVEVNRREVAERLYKFSQFLLEAATVLTISGRAIQFMSRELGYEESRRIRFPRD